MLEILLNLLNPPSASQPSSRSVEMNTPSKQHSLMQSRQSMHSRPAHYEETNFRHKAQSQDTTQSDMSNETTIPVVPFYTGMKIVNKPFISNNFSNNNDANPHTHKDKQLVQYHDPHQRKLNVLSKNHHKNEYNDDNDEIMMIMMNPPANRHHTTPKKSRDRNSMTACIFRFS
jgi:hypothetical protein